MEYRENTINISLSSIVKFVGVVLFVTALFYLRDLVFVLLMSVVLASAVEPGTLWFVNRKIPRLFSVLIVYIIMAVCLFGALFFILIPLLSEASDLLKNFPAYFNATTLANLFANNDFLSSQPIVSGLTDSLNLEQIVSQINTLIGTISTNVFGTVATVFGGLVSFILTIILSFYLSVEEDGVGKFLKTLSPAKHEKYISALWKRSQRKIGLWMQGQLVLAIIIGMLVYLGLLMVGLPNALLLAMLAAIFEIIPLFGPILASIPAIIIALTTGGVPMGLIVIGLYVIVHQFENQLIYPLVVKKVVGVSPIVSIIALTAGFQLAGFVGLILAVPLASALIEFVSDFEKDKIEKTERMLNNS